MDELNKMDVVETVTDTVSDFTNSSNGVGGYITGGIMIGAGVTALGVVAYKCVIEPLWKKAKVKAKLLKAKRAKNDDVPGDVEEEYPIN